MTTPPTPSPKPSRRPPLAALRMVFAGVMLIVVWLVGGAGAIAIPAAISVTGAITGVWILGTPPTRPGSGAAARRDARRRRADRWISAAFFLSLGGGALLATGVFGSSTPADSALPPGGAPPGLPLPLLGLLFGVFLLPLLLTGIGFALTFRPPAPDGLAALRRAAAERSAPTRSPEDPDE